MAETPRKPRRSVGSIRGLLGMGAPRAGPAAIEEAVRRVFAPHLESAAGRRLSDAWRGTLRALRPLGAVSLGNRVQVLADGDAVFEAMWAALAAARREVLMTTYTLEPDAVGMRTLAELAAAARRGCRVTLIYDSIGSFRLADRQLADLRAAGANVVPFNPLLRLRTRLPRLVRNHQKILVVDGEVGLCGGMNVAEEYAGARLGNDYFRDTHLILRGPCVPDLAEVLLGVLDDVPGRADAGETTAGPSEENASASDAGCLVQILESNVRRQRRAIQRAMRMTLRRAVQRCYFTTPYFVPPLRLMRALVRAAGRGVDVRVLTAGRSDQPIVRLASRHLHGRLLARGVRIFELQGRALHAKTMSVDSVYASVGSFNLDRWSDRRNLEVNVCMLDDVTAREVEAQFEADLESAREVRLEEWSHRHLGARLLYWAAYQLMRL